MHLDGIATKEGVPIWKRRLASTAGEAARLRRRRSAPEQASVIGLGPYRTAAALVADMVRLQRFFERPAAPAGRVPVVTDCVVGLSYDQEEGFWVDLSHDGKRFVKEVTMATPKGLGRTPPVRLWLSWPGRRMGASAQSSLRG